MSIFDWSLTAASNGNADATINFQEGQAPSTVNDSARALMARMAFYRNWSAGNMTQGGSSNAYTITSGESLTAYTNGMRFLWKPNANSSGAVTLNVDSIGAKKVYLPAGTQAVSGSIDADAVYDVVYQSALDSSNGGFKIVGAPDTAGYSAGGTDVALADGGTGASLADPNADRILFWDDSAGAMTWLATGTGLTISGTSITVDSTVWTSANDGAGSGLDADTVDGVQASALVQTSGAQSVSGQKTITSPLLVSTAQARFEGADSPPSGAAGVGLEIYTSSGTVVLQAFNRTSIAFATLNVAASLFTIGSKSAARVNSGTATNSGLISWGTAAPGALAEGEIYLRHA